MNDKDNITGYTGKSFIETGAVYAPYIPMAVTNATTGTITFSNFVFPQIKGKPVYDDPVKQIKHDMGYEIEPDRYEKPMTLGPTEILSVQPMTTSSSAIFYLDYQYVNTGTVSSGSTTTTSITGQVI